LAAFDAEELGLKGSEYFVNHPIMSSKDMVLNINMDMISRSEKKELFVIGTSENKMLKHPEFYIEAVKTIISVFEKIDKTEI